MVQFIPSALIGSALFGVSESLRPHVIGGVLAASAPLGLAIGLGSVLFLAGVGLIVLGASWRNGTTTPQDRIGIRTGATQRSEHAWQVGHQAAGPFLIIAGLSAAVPGIVTMFRPPHNTMIAIIMIGLGVMVGFVALGSAMAHTKAVTHHRFGADPSDRP